MNSSELQKNHFDDLKEKYQVDKYQYSEFDSFLYLILRKASIGIHITYLELKWLEEKRLFDTIKTITLQQYQAEDQKRLEGEFLQLKTKYQIPENLEIPLSSLIYSILWKVDTGYIHTLTSSEVKLLNNHNLSETIILIQDVLNFSNLKLKYRVTNYLNQSPKEPLYSILKKLDARDELSDSESNWLLENSCEAALEIYWQQEEQRQADLEFLELKSKYQVSFHPDFSASSLLYPILKKLKAKQELDPNECIFLKRQNLSKLLEIDQARKQKRSLTELKQKYKASHYQNLDPTDPLLKLLGKLELIQDKTSIPWRNWKLLLTNPETQISEDDIEWLIDNGLSETAKIVQRIHFKLLKSKYQIVGNLAVSPFYEIMLKLEREERLDPKQVIQLIEDERLSRHGKIAIAHYKLEAKFYEEEYKRTGSKWNLPSASSNWRKADEPKEALKVTEQVNWNKVQEPDLKSALWVTRGGAFRDLGQLLEAENCAAEAMECQPDSHQPYTLMGAICYDRSEYADGDKWFELAAERGGNEPDNEIEKVIRMTKDKDKRREAAKYLLNKDSKRYAWAKAYLKEGSQ